jgi:hypothetical protein
MYAPPMQDLQRPVPSLYDPDQPILVMPMLFDCIPKKFFDVTLPLAW